MGASPPGAPAPLRPHWDLENRQQQNRKMLETLEATEAARAGCSACERGAQTIYVRHE